MTSLTVSGMLLPHRLITGVCATMSDILVTPAGSGPLCLLLLLPLGDPSGKQPRLQGLIRATDRLRRLMVSGGTSIDCSSKLHTHQLDGQPPFPTKPLPFTPDIATTSMHTR